MLTYLLFLLQTTISVAIILSCSVHFFLTILYMLFFYLDFLIYNIEVNNLHVLTTSLFGLFIGTIGTFFGGLISIFLKNISEKFLSFVLALSAGLMISVVCFELLPEASLHTNIIQVVVGLLFGIFVMIICDIFVSKKLSKKYKTTNSTLRTGIVVSIGLALHNIPEGLAIGSGLESSVKLGLALALTIAIHDIPEGISMSAPLKKSGVPSPKILFYILLSGIATGIGSIIGSIFGTISENVLAYNLSFAAGAMLYVISGELTPEYSKLYSGKMNVIANLLGFILGYIVTQF